MLDNSIENSSFNYNNIQLFSDEEMNNQEKEYI